MRNTLDRIRHAVGFEVLGLAIGIPLAVWLLEHDPMALGALGVGISVLATVWNMVFNWSWDRVQQRRRGHTHKTPTERVFHALVFELGLLIMTLPVIAYVLNVSLWQAFIMDVGVVVYYVVFAYVYNWLYDVVFPIPKAP